jgi:hypothetical protein
LARQATPPADLSSRAARGSAIDQSFLESGQGDSSRQRTLPAALRRLSRFARSLHSGFHEIIRPMVEPIKAFEARKKRMVDYRNQR